MLSWVDAMVRGGAISVGVIAVLVFFATPMMRRKSLSFGALVICLTGYLVVSSPAHELLPPLVYRIGVLGAIIAPVALTWVVLDIFLDTSGRRWAWIGFACTTSLAALIGDRIDLVRGALELMLYIGLLYLALASAKDDLVEKRRTFRPVFVALMAGFGAIKTVLELSLSEAAMPEWLFLLQASMFLLLSMLFCLWALQPGLDIWAGATPRRKPGKTGMEAAENHIISRVEAAIESEIWRREGLTIGSMAEELNLPEHRLRLAINKGLGHRNFASFINGYRIEAAKAALAAPKNGGVTILEIAYECGFASLGPFNKAFRAMTGQNPRDYRRGAGVVQAG